MGFNVKKAFSKVRSAVTSKPAQGLDVLTTGGVSTVTTNLGDRRTREKGGQFTRLTGSESAGGIFDAPYRMLTGYDPNKINRSDVPAPESAPEPLKDAPAEARRARERALFRALQSFGLQSTQKTGGLGLTGSANVKRPTLGA